MIEVNWYDMGMINSLCEEIAELINTVSIFSIHDYLDLTYNVLLGILYTSGSHPVKTVHLGREEKPEGKKVVYYQQPRRQRLP